MSVLCLSFSKLLGFVLCLFSDLFLEFGLSFSFFKQLVSVIGLSFYKLFGFGFLAFFQVAWFWLSLILELVSWLKYLFCSVISLLFLLATFLFSSFLPYRTTHYFRVVTYGKKPNAKFTGEFSDEC